jgi:hypothetical protein
MLSISFDYSAEIQQQDPIVVQTCRSSLDIHLTTKQGMQRFGWKKKSIKES